MNLHLPANLPPHVIAVLQDAVEVALPTPDDFLKVKETLTRIGIASRKDNTLYQSCHILHKQGHYFVVHFKELFLLDGKVQQTEFTQEDKGRRNTIARMLHDWGLVKLVYPQEDWAQVYAAPQTITVLPFREKSKWKLVAKYEVGKKR